MTNRQIGFLAITFSISGYALLPIMTRTLYQISSLEPTDIAIWRFIFATPAIWLVIQLRENFGGKKPASTDKPFQIVKMMALGLLYTGAALSAFFGLQYIPAGLYSALFYTYPVIVAFISLFLGQTLHLKTWLAIGLTLMGMFLVIPDLSIAGENTVLGLLIAILNAVFVAIYFVIISHEMPKVSSVSRGAAYIITGTLGFLLLLIPFFGLQFPENPTTWLLLLALATWSTAMPIFVVNIAIQHLGVTRTSIISTAEPIVTMTLGLFLLNEAVLPMQWLGVALIVSGVIILELRSKKKLIQS